MTTRCGLRATLLMSAALLTRTGVARAEGGHALAEERCDDQRGKARSACISVAKGRFSKA